MNTQQVELDALLEKKSPEEILAAIRKMKRAGNNPPAGEVGHCCPSCKSKNIYFLQRPIRWMHRKMTKLRCKACRYKWTRYEYPEMK